jgi:peptidoglycan hydrolase-like protein with peptidoglycan-binding domain
MASASFAQGRAIPSQTVWTRCRARPLLLARRPRTARRTHRPMPKPIRWTRVASRTSPSQVLQAQQELKSQGLYRGAIDGVVGPETQTAVSQFQKQQGLPQTAQLDQQTLDRLNGSNAGAPQGTRTAPMGTQNPAMQRSPPANR